MTEILNKLLAILEDNSGGISSSRVLMLAWGLSILIIWVYLSIHTGGFVTIPPAIITIMLGLVGFKTVQRFGEKTAPKENSVAPATTILKSP